MKKIVKWFLGFCLVMVIFSMAIMGALIAGIAFLGYKAYQEYQVNKFSNKFKAQCVGVIVLSLVLIGLCSGNTDKTTATETSSTKQEETVKKEDDNKSVEIEEYTQEELLEMYKDESYMKVSGNELDTNPNKEIKFLFEEVLKNDGKRSINKIS